MAPELTSRLADALDWAIDIHRDQTRKATDIPYVSHLLAVTALVLEGGGDETTAIAALLHDAIEDSPHVDHATVERRFGTEVADIVRACSDDEPADPTHKRPWELRKREYLAHLEATTDERVLLVSLADKTHNAHSTAREVARRGPVTWEKFTKGEGPQRWWYTSLLSVFERKLPDNPLTADLRESVQALFGPSMVRDPSIGR